jgi:hypothetical protein
VGKVFEEPERQPRDRKLHTTGLPRHNDIKTTTTTTTPKTPPLQAKHLQIFGNNCISLDQVRGEEERRKER